MENWPLTPTGLICLLQARSLASLGPNRIYRLPIDTPHPQSSRFSSRNVSTNLPCYSRCLLIPCHTLPFLIPLVSFQFLSLFGHQRKDRGLHIRSEEVDTSERSDNASRLKQCGQLVILHWCIASALIYICMLAMMHYAHMIMWYKN